VNRFALENLENQHVERALKQIGFSHRGFALSIVDRATVAHLLSTVNGRKLTGLRSYGQRTSA
jgi:hypothetical protein